MQQLSEIPRALGYAEQDIHQALISTLAPQSLSNDATYAPGVGQGNPFSDMGISDAEFTTMLSGLVAYESPATAAKRFADDIRDPLDTGDRKRGRFE